MKRITMTLMFLGSFGMGVVSASRAEAACSTVQSGDWSIPATWGGSLPTMACDVTINPGHRVTVSGTGQARQIEILPDATLEVVSGGTLELHDGSLINRGTFLGGPVGRVEFHVTNDRTFTGNTTPGPDSMDPDFHPEDYGFWGLMGSETRIDGEAVTPWLDALPKSNSGPQDVYGTFKLPTIGNGSVTLASVPQGWRVGDKLLLTALEGDYALADISGINGTTINYNHLSNPDFTAFTLKHDSIKNDVRYVRPKVANLTRRFQIVAVNVKEGDVHHRAHTVYMHNAKSHLNYVEFRNLGPRGKLGRYPVHFHHQTIVSQAELLNSSIWQDVNEAGSRFVSLHNVSGVKVDRNVGLRSFGHGYFMEMGKEENNFITNNLSVDVRQLNLFNGDTEELKVDDQETRISYHYWLRADNTIEGNVSVGPTEASLAGVKALDGKTDVRPAGGSSIILKNKMDGAPNIARLNREQFFGCGYPYRVEVLDVQINDFVGAYCHSSLFEPSSTPRPVVNNPTMFYTPTAPFNPFDAYSAGNVISYNLPGLRVNGGLLVGHILASNNYLGGMVLTDVRMFGSIAVFAGFFETSSIVQGPECYIKLVDGPQQHVAGHPIGKVTPVIGGPRKRNGTGLVSLRCAGEINGTPYAANDPNSPLNVDYTSVDAQRVPPLEGTDNVEFLIRRLNKRLGPAGFLVRPTVPEAVSGSHTLWRVYGADQDPLYAHELFFGVGDVWWNEDESLWMEKLQDERLGYPDGFAADPTGTKYHVHLIHYPTGLGGDTLSAVQYVREMTLFPGQRNADFWSSPEVRLPYISYGVKGAQWDREGTTVTVPFYYKNAGSSRASNVRIRLPLSAKTFVSATNGGTHDPVTNTITWDVPDLEPEQEGNVRFVMMTSVFQSTITFDANTAAYSDKMKIFYDAPNGRRQGTDMWITITRTDGPPVISAQPTAQTAIVGQTASFSVAATGTSPMNHQWQKKALGSTAFTNVDNNIDGAVYTTPLTQISQDGTQYRVVITNNVGTATSDPATLTVKAAETDGPPRIITHPATKSVQPNQSVTFSVTANAGASPVFQWQRKRLGESAFTDIHEGTAHSRSFTLTATLNDDLSFFRVVVKNSAGTVTSLPAQLIVVVSVNPTNPNPTNPGPTKPNPTNPGPTNPNPTNPNPTYPAESTEQDTDIDPALWIQNRNTGPVRFPSAAKVRIYDQAGQLVVALQGTRLLEWAPRGASGVYHCDIERHDGERVSRKLILVR